MGTKLAAVAPLVIPLDLDTHAIEGFIPIIESGQEHQYWFKVSGISATHGSTLEHATVELDESAERLLGQNGKELVAVRLKDSPDVSSFLVEFRSILSSVSSSSRLPPPPSLSTSSGPVLPTSLRSHRSPLFFSHIKNDLDAIGWERVAHLSPDLSVLSLQCMDAGSRAHTLTLSLPPDFPSSPPTVLTADVPIPFNIVTGWKPNRSGYITHALQQFETVIESCQRLWDDLDDLDAHAWVIEPTAPTRSSLFRRVALQNHVTVAITIDPRTYIENHHLQAPPLIDAIATAMPDLKFMGSDAAVDPLLTLVRSNRSLWVNSPHRTLRENLIAVLGRDALPEKDKGEGGSSTHQQDTLTADCAICYNYRRPTDHHQTTLEQAHDLGDLPEINCDNIACSKPFHKLCLREWLASDASTRQSFDTLFGACPYCSAPIAVKTR